jgi:hypothetical protein
MAKLFSSRILEALSMNDNSLNEKLAMAVLRNLMALPAYRLTSRSKEKFEKHAYDKLKRSIRNTPVDEIHTQSSSPTEKIQDIYQSPSSLEIWKYSWRFLSKKYRWSGYIAFLTLITALYYKFFSTLMNPIGGIPVVVFAFSFFIFGIGLIMEHTMLDSTFSITDRITEKVRDYIGEIEAKYVLAENIEEVALDCSADIIKSDLAGLPNLLMSADLVHWFTAFALVFIIVFFSGDSSFYLFKSLTHHFGYDKVSLIKDLSPQSFLIFIYFSGVPLSRYCIGAGLEARRRRLQRSFDLNRHRYSNPDDRRSN